MPPVPSVPGADIPPPTSSAVRGADGPLELGSIDIPPVPPVPGAEAPGPGSGAGGEAGGAPASAGSGSLGRCSGPVLNVRATAAAAAPRAPPTSLPICSAAHEPVGPDSITAHSP